MDYNFPFFLEASSQFGYSDLQRIVFFGHTVFHRGCLGYALFHFQLYGHLHFQLYGHLKFFFWADGWKFTQVQANNFAGATHLGWTLNNLQTAGRSPGFA